MNELILRLMNDISALTQPVDPLFLKVIFDSYSLIEESPSADVAAQHQILLHLKALTTEYLNLTEELKDQELNQKRLDTLIEANNEALLTRDALFKKIQISQQLLTTDYAIIDKAANIFLQTQNPLATPVHFPELNDMQHTFVTDLDVELERLIRETDLKRAKLQLTLLKHKLAASSEELMAAGFIPDADVSSPRLNTIAASIQKEIFKLDRTLKDGERLQSQFARQLSVTELQSKKDGVMREIQDLEEKLSKIEKDISESTLSAEVQSQIRQEFEESTNIPELLSAYESRQSSVWSYVDPSAWFSWLNSNQQYDEQQNMYAQSFIFLQLLDRRKEFILQKEALLKEQIQLERIVLDNPETEDQGLMQLITDTIVLLRSIPSGVDAINLTQNTPAIDCYLTLIKSLPAVSDSLDQCKATLDKLSELSSIVLTIEALRNEFRLTIENDGELPTIEEAEKDDGNLLTEEPLQKERALLKTCKRYLINLQQLNVIIEELDDAIMDQELIIQHIDSRKGQLLSKEQIDKIGAHLIVLAKNIAEQIEELKRLPLPQVQDEKTVIRDATISESLVDETPVPEESRDFVSEMSETSDHSSSPESADEDSDWSKETQIDTNSVASPYEATEVSSSESYSDDSESTELLVSHSPDLMLTDTADKGVTVPTVATSSDADSDEYKSIECELISVGDSPSQLRLSDLDAVLDTPMAYDAVVPGSVRDTDILPDLSEGFSQQDDNEHLNSNFSDNSPAPEQIGMSKLPVRKSLLLTTLDNIDKWHHENLSLLVNHPDEVQNWYHALHQSIKELSFDESQCHKASQLLRDILFELQNKKDLSVIQAYMRLCPDPKLSVKPLLDLKPALLITDMSYNETNELMDCPLELRQHYAHYFKLRNQFPVEAELFLQAVRTVHLIKLYMNIPGHKITPDQIPSLAADPRYEPLKRHRGFLRVWEFLEDLCRLIFAKITGQPEHEYTNRPCRFFKPKSAQLIEEADLMMRSALPESTVSLS
ncbi:hypothetical protein [Legionella shakespearei]|uniref:Interaptin n=1 Tax=Legionella shakespearei DSM 23087 TaxID=1122169 RepID=A0A0W0YQK6_9GAMM|nr:hypothetical protein [Legionella shakespearei]KTD59162.1 interaptin [Legionella shakespearei DSM 23087]